MKSSRLYCKRAIVITLAGLLHLVEAADNANKFRRCYNTSVETHCFDAQYDISKNGWLYTSFENARRLCLGLNSTLLIIKDEETNEIVRQYLDDSNNPIKTYSVWADAYRISDFNNTYTWHWVDSTLPTVKASDVQYTYDYKYYVAVLEITFTGYYLTAKGPSQEFNYICEYPASKCPTSSSNNLRQFNGRCYVAVKANVSWFEARNRCLMGDGDLASFVNVTSINFTSWLGSVPYTRYYIGLQFTWYIWIDTGEKVGYSNWKPEYYGQNTPCLVALYDNPSLSLSWYPKESTADVNVVCHTVTPINPPTISTTTSTTITATSTLTPSKGSQNSTETSREDLAIGVGVGVGVGVPILIVLIICVVIRFKICSKNDTSNDTAELGTVGGPSIGQVNNTTNDQYQHLNFTLDKSPETTYDKLKVKPEQPYAECPTNIT